jgi:hypothetical protein
MAARALAPRRPDPPAEAVASYAEPAFAAPRADRGALTATWVGHSTFLLQIGGLNVLTDPVWAGRASPLAWAGPRRWARPGVALERCRRSTSWCSRTTTTTTSTPTRCGAWPRARTGRAGWRRSAWGRGSGR